MAFMSPPSLPPAPVDGASPLQQQPGPWHVRQTARFAAAIAFPGERFVGVAMRVPGNAGPEDAALPWQTVVNEAVARFVGFYGEQVAIAALFHRHCVVGATNSVSEIPVWRAGVVEGNVPWYMLNGELHSLRADVAAPQALAALQAGAPVALAPAPTQEPLPQIADASFLPPDTPDASPVVPEKQKREKEEKKKRKRKNKPKSAEKEPEKKKRKLAAEKAKEQGEASGAPPPQPTSPKGKAKAKDAAPANGAALETPGKRRGRPPAPAPPPPPAPVPPPPPPAAGPVAQIASQMLAQAARAQSADGFQMVGGHRVYNPHGYKVVIDKQTGRPKFVRPRGSGKKGMTWNYRTGGWEQGMDDAPGPSTHAAVTPEKPKAAAAAPAAKDDGDDDSEDSSDSDDSDSDDDTE